MRDSKLKKNLNIPAVNLRFTHKISWQSRFFRTSLFGHSKCQKSLQYIILNLANELLVSSWILSPVASQPMTAIQEIHLMG
jgi:hypothetical protein